VSVIYKKEEYEQSLTVSYKGLMKSNHDISGILPGAVILEHIKKSEMKKEEFYERMFLSSEFADKLLDGKMRLTYDIALRLKHVFGMPTDYWLKLEAAYRMKSNKSQ